MQRSSQKVHQGGRDGEDEPGGHPPPPLDGDRGGGRGPTGADARPADPPAGPAPAEPPGPQLRRVGQLPVPAQGPRQALQEGPGGAAQCSSQEKL